MLKENGLLIFLILFIFGLGLGMNFLSSSKQDLSEPIQEENEKSSDSDYEFSEKGNIVEQSDGWFLVYEKPGAPGLTVKLNFAENSVCKLPDTNQCDSDKFEQGMRVEVKGEKENNRLNVNKLTNIE